MTDELATLNESRDVVASREESDPPPGRSPRGSPERPPRTKADWPATVLEPCDERHQVAPGLRIGAYLVLALSSSDDQVQVFRVHHPELRREFVLKLYRGVATDNPAARERLRREGRLVVACRHPNLLEIVDVDFHDGHLFVVTERVRGLSLTDYARERRPGAREAAGLVIELARGVDYIHARGIIHQDLTQSNILIDETGRPRLMDFGLARLRAAVSVDPNGPTGSSTSELNRSHVTDHDEPVGPATDVFGLGTVLKHVLTAEPAESRPLGTPLLAQENETEKPPFRSVYPGVPRSLRRICEKAMHPDQNRRYRSAAELGRALRRYRSRRWFVWTASVIMAVLAALFFVRP